MCPKQLLLQVFHAVPSPFGFLGQLIDDLWIDCVSVTGVVTWSGDLGCMGLIRCTGSILLNSDVSFQGPLVMVAKSCL